MKTKKSEKQKDFFFVATHWLGRGWPSRWRPPGSTSERRRGRAAPPRRSSTWATSRRRSRRRPASPPRTTSALTNKDTPSITPRPLPVLGTRPQANDGFPSIRCRGYTRKLQKCRRCCALFFAFPATFHFPHWVMDIPSTSPRGNPFRFDSSCPISQQYYRHHNHCQSKTIVDKQSRTVVRI